MITGIVIGLCAALLQSAAYVCSRVFTRRHPGSSIDLLIIAHLILGIPSLALVAFLAPWKYVPLQTIALQVFLAMAPYWFAQVILFSVLKRVHASRVSPLLGMKVIIMAGISLLFLGGSYTLVQWAAIVLCAVAVVGSERLGGRLPPLAFAGIVVVATLYSVSDVFIRQTVDALGPMGTTGAVLAAVGLGYGLNAFLALVLLPFTFRRLAGKWGGALPYSAAWLGAMVLTFASIGLIGVVYANIVQSTRGIFSVALGGILAARGYVALEQRDTKAALARRVAAAVCISAAIALFYLGAGR